MDFQNDPELEKLFKDELDERSRSLAEGAEAMAAGDMTPDLAGRMLREGHTIKGTGRVMGYEGIAQGGETCELVWRWVQQGDVQPSSMLARTLEHLAQAIPDAIGGNGHEVSVAIDTVRALIADPALVEQLPNPVADSGDESVEEAEAVEPDEITEIEAETADESAEESADAIEEEPPEVVLDDVTSLDKQDIEDVSAALDEIESEVTRDREHPGDRPQDEAIATDDETPDTAESESEDDAQASEPSETQESAAESVDVETTTKDTDEAPDSAAVSADLAGSADESADALVFEPGPDGRLPTPKITYEIVTSAFADIPPTSAAAGDGSLGEPPSLSVVESGSSVLDPDKGAVYDLGGLLGAVETWATEESVPVNAGRLFRLINDVAALRIDLDSAVIQSSQLLQSTGSGASAAALEGALESLETVRRASLTLQNSALGLTAIPLETVTATLPQLTKYLSKKVEREVELVLEGEDTIVDRQLVDKIGEIIRQLVVNAVAHGIESTDERIAAGKPEQGTVKVALSRNEQHIQIVVTDDGSGIDWKAVRALAGEREMVGDDPTIEELRSVLYSEGFSTNPKSTEFTGEGDGLARVTGIVEDVFGTMTLDSAPGRGTTFVVTMPAHRALQRAQIFTAGGRTWGIPETSVTSIVAIPDVKITVSEQGSFITTKDETVPYSSFATVVGLDVDGLPSQVMMLTSATGTIALAVDDVLELSEVATKDLSPLLAGSDTVVSGVALLGGDETVMLVDAGRLAEKMRDTETKSAGPVHTVLVVDDSQGVRQVVSGVLASHGFATLVAGSVSDALATLSRYDVDALVVDFSMPRADGVALIHMVRQRYGDVPVVMLSGVASEEDRARAERAGAHAFFDKADFAKGALVEKLRELIDGEDTGKAEIAS
jgi:chemotaxis protein histidine kinase CheA